MGCQIQLNLRSRSFGHVEQSLVSMGRKEQGTPSAKPRRLSARPIFRSRVGRAAVDRVVICPKRKVEFDNATAINKKVQPHVELKPDLLFRPSEEDDSSAESEIDDLLA